MIIIIPCLTMDVDVSYYIYKRRGILLACMTRTISE